MKHVEETIKEMQEQIKDIKSWEERKQNSKLRKKKNKSSIKNQLN